ARDRALRLNRGLAPVSRLQRDGRTARGGLVQRPESARLADCVLAAEQQLALTADRGADVLELQPVGVRVLELDPLDAVVMPHLDDGLVAVPRVVEEERALAPNRLELVAVHEGGAAVERRDHVAGEPQRPGEDPIGARRPEPRLAPDALRLAAEQPRAGDVVTADVHQRAALEFGAQPDVAFV